MNSHYPWNIVYATSSSYKIQENEVFARCYRFGDDTLVSERFLFDIRDLRIQEELEVDISEMVTAEVARAYEQIKVPCIVEHAGLIFDDHTDRSYPGGLTKAMWNELGNDFVRETNSAGRRAVARAVVAYCDGSKISTFVGDTRGIISAEPRGSREFYWDTVFIPDSCEGLAAGLTYAEIVDHPKLGLEYKVTELSQSSKAMCSFLDHVLANGPPQLWGRFP